MVEAERDKILVLDFGGQYTQLIAKRVRESGTFSEIKDCNYNIGEIIRNPPKGIILSGGPDSVYGEGAPYINEYLLELGIPVLGLCYGMQHINDLLGGGTLHGDDVIGEYGGKEVKVDNSHPLFKGLEDIITAWMSHGDSVDGDKLAKGFMAIASTDDHIAAIANNERGLYGIQFHPEVTHTPRGSDIISNFVHDICGADHSWTTGNYIEEAKQYVRDKVKGRDIINFVSDGVDSSFVTALLAQTESIGKVHNVYIEGLMREGETEEVVSSLKKAGVDDLIVVKAEERFLEAVKGLRDPEEKRKAIGNMFGEIQGEICQSLGLDPDNTVLAQGTLYTDRIESGQAGGKKQSNIKSHHNVDCEFIKGLKAKKLIVEPNRMIFKDEVRKAAKEIGLPPEIYLRQPYPGPGLGIRIVDAWHDFVKDVFYYNSSDDVGVIAGDHDLDATLMPLKTVGVQGDDRTYSYVAVLRGKRDWKNIRAAAREITEKIPNVNRVVYDVNPESSDIGYIESGIETLVDRENIDRLKSIDHVGRGIIDDYDLSSSISQTIFVLHGGDIYNNGKQGVCLRAVSTEDYMTVAPVEPKDVLKGDIASSRESGQHMAMTWECLDEIYSTLMARGDVGSFVIDVTDKPPSTTCWE